MKRFSALLFDVDGTLAETEELHRQAFNETFVSFNLPWVWDVAFYRQLLRVPGGKERIRHFVQMATEMDRTISDNDVLELHRSKTARYTTLIESGACQLRPGISDLIRAASARGQQLAIVTTTTRRNVEALLDATLGSVWTQYFRALICGDDVRHKKPAPDAYIKALDCLALPAHRCLAIEDSRNGLLAARSAGVPVLITRSAYFQDENFDDALQIVGDLTELENGLLTCNDAVLRN